MSRKTDGGPAFPVVAPDITFEVEYGASLRDYFAAKAMQGWAASITTKEMLARADAWATADLKPGAEWAYRVADAMLAARQSEARVTEADRTPAEARAPSGAPP